MTNSTTKKKLHPVNDRILVRQLKAEEKTPGGILLPEQAKEKPKEGDVLAVGPGRFDDKGQRVPMSCAKGDRIVFASYAGIPVKLDGEELLMVSDKDVLGVLR